MKFKKDFTHFVNGQALEISKDSSPEDYDELNESEVETLKRMKMFASQDDDPEKSGSDVRTPNNDELKEGAEVEEETATTKTTAKKKK